MRVKALKNHAYHGRRITVGQEYDIFSKTDATVLRVAGIIKEVAKLEPPPAPAPASAPKPVAEPEPDPLEPDESDANKYESNELKPRSRRRRYGRKDMSPKD